MPPSKHRAAPADYWDYLHNPSFGPASATGMQPADDFKDDWSDSRWVGHPGGAWGGVPMSSNRRDSAPFVPQGGPGNPLGVRVATPGIGIPSRSQPITNNEDDDISEATVSDAGGEEDGIKLYDNQLFEEETEPAPKPLKQPSLADAYAQTSQYFIDLIKSVHNDNTQAEELNKGPGPPAEEKRQEVPVLDAVTAGITNKLALGDHASAVALLRKKKAEEAKTRVLYEPKLQKDPRGAAKNGFYRSDLKKEPVWQPGAKHPDRAPYKIRAVMGPVNPDAQGGWVELGNRPLR